MNNTNINIDIGLSNIYNNLYDCDKGQVTEICDQVFEMFQTRNENFAKIYNGYTIPAPRLQRRNQNLMQHSSDVFVPIRVQQIPKVQMFRSNSYVRLINTDCCNLLRDFMRAFLEIGSFESEKYSISCIKFGTRAILKLSAINRNDKSKRLEIMIEFVLQFSSKFWPPQLKPLQNNCWPWWLMTTCQEQFLEVRIPLLEEECWSDIMKCPALCLLMSLRDRNEIGFLTNGMLASVIMRSMKSDRILDILIESLTIIIDDIEKQYSPCYWSDSANYLENVCCTQRYNSKVKLQSILQVLKKMSVQVWINFNELVNIFT